MKTFLSLWFSNNFVLKQKLTFFFQKMYQLLLPGMFHYNNYRSHPDYPKLEMTDAECRAFDVSGLQNHQKRMVIYKFMLSNVPEMVRLKCIHFVCTVVSVLDALIYFLFQIQTSVVFLIILKG